jgi:HAD superfamily hydrolase (TIGR01509 family)
MPMAGEGSRFKNSTYNVPKPLIKINETPLFLRALSSLESINIKKRYTFVVRQEHIHNYEIDKIIKIYFPDANIASVEKTTRGAVETVLYAEKYIDNNEGILVIDCDLEFSSKNYNRTIENCLSADTSEIDGGVLVSFHSTNEQYSYAAVDGNGLVIKTAEKKAISANALIGSYFFSHGKTFLQAAHRLMREQNLQSPELYVSLLYNYLIQDKFKVVLTKTDNYYSYGTPDELKLSEAYRKQQDTIQLIITDFDGTLVNTYNANYNAYKVVLSRYGINFEESLYRKYFGLRFDMFMAQLGVTDSTLQAKIKNEKSEVYKQNFNLLRVNMPLLQFLRAFRRMGGLVAIASTAHSVNLLNVLNYFQLENDFDCILSGDDVNQPKPNPEIYITIMNKLNVPASRTLVFEDSSIGIEAAKSAGTSCIKITEEFYGI